MKDILIVSVKLKEGGLKGIELEYKLPSIKNKCQFIDTYKVKKWAPIHKELEETFSWLKDHLLDVCGYPLDKLHRANISVTKVSYGDNGFIISGELIVFDSGKLISLTTPLVTEDDEYKNFDKITSIINGIYTEVKEYLVGNKKMSDEQIVIRYSAKNPEFDADSFKGMSKADKQEMATKILQEQCGVTVVILDHDDVTIDDEPNIVTKEEVVDPFEFDANPKEVSTPFVQVEEHIQNQPEIVLTTSEFSDDTFILPVEPVKVSTAKKKVKA